MPRVRLTEQMIQTAKKPGELWDAEVSIKSDPDPSAEDVALTRRLASAGSLLGIEIIDHLILGEAGRYVSLKERAFL